MKKVVKRILLKLSGEALMGSSSSGISSDALNKVALQIRALVVSAQSYEVAIVVGAGNFCRGKQLEKTQIIKSTADQMGMLATNMNALALRDTLKAYEIQSEVMSALPVTGVCASFDSHKARQLLADQVVTIFAGGTGNPFVTTDTAAALRAAEVQADLLLKGTQVDGVYDKDPQQYPNAKKLTRLSFDDVITQQLEVMDQEAFFRCKKHRIPIVVFDIHQPNCLLDAIQGRTGSQVD